MSFRFKNTIRFLVFTLVAILLLSANSINAQALEINKVIPVKVTSDEGFTRISFDMPKLTAYYVKSNKTQTEINFDIKARTVFSSKKSPEIKSIKSAINKKGLLQVTIHANPNTSIKDYRVRKKIIFEIHSKDIKKKPVEKKAEKEKKSIKIKEAVKLPANKVVEVKKEKIAIDTDKAIDKEAIVTQIKESLAKIETKPTETKKVVEEKAKKIEKIDSDELNPDFYNKNPTKIILSSLEPSKLAAFKRANTLWVVTDSISQKTLPEITGPLKNFITDPKVLKFKNGTAYAYTLPQKYFIETKKEKLSWQVLLYSRPIKKQQHLEIKTHFDEDGKNAKVSIASDNIGEAIAFQDLTIGDYIYVVPTKKQSEFIIGTKNTPDFEMLPTATGIVVRPLKDDVKAYKVDNHLFISSPNGLSLTPVGTGTPVLIGEDEGNIAEIDNKRIFDFPNWRLGGIRLLRSNKAALQELIATASSEEDRAALLMKLAMLYFSNNYGHETLGVLDLALQESPELKRNSKFIAIRGAANAMSGRYKDALKDLSHPSIQKNPEIKLWVGFAAAATEQWHMANKHFPSSNRLLLQYPDNIAIPLTIYMAESSLRLGKTKTADKLLSTINMKSEAINIQHRSAINYLKGEIYNQEKRYEKAEELWTPVVNGVDRLYHTKASISLTKLLLKLKKITIKEAIENLENLRFAWRGDGLETAALITLGKLKAQDRQPLSALQDLDRAIKLDKKLLNDTTRTEKIMVGILNDLFMKNGTQKIKPLEAISVYNEFSHMLPKNYSGIIATLHFANYLIAADLLDKAAELIELQLKEDLPVTDLPDIGSKLAAVYILNKEPNKALDTIRKTNAGSLTKEQYEERAILKAKALSQANRINEAAATLTSIKSKDATKLKADLFWQAEQWQSAAETLETILPGTKELLNDGEISLVLNTAIAWKLAEKSDKLKEIKDKYSHLISDTKTASTFEVITRDGGKSSLSDRETTLQIAQEADVFKDFLDAYKKNNPVTK